MEPIADETAQSIFAAIDTYGAASEGWQESTWQGLIEKVIYPWLSLQKSNIQTWQHTRFRQHAGEHLPPFFSHLSAFYPKIRWTSLVLLVQLILQYVWNDEFQTAMLGVNLMKSLVLAIGSQLDPEGWNVILCGLRLATLHRCWEDASGVIDTLHAASGNYSKANIRVQESLELDAQNRQKVRDRCHLTLMMLRCIDLIHEGCYRFLSTVVEIQMLEIVLDAIDQATDFSVDQLEHEELRETLPSLSSHFRHLKQKQEGNDFSLASDLSVQEPIVESQQEVEEANEQETNNIQQGTQETSQEIQPTNGEMKVVETTQQIDQDQNTTNEKKQEDEPSDQSIGSKERMENRSQTQKRQQQEVINNDNHSYLLQQQQQQQQQQPQQLSKQNQEQPQEELHETSDGVEVCLRTSKKGQQQGSQYILVRQLVEGGLLLLKMMKRTLSDTESKISKDRCTAVEEKLVQFCQDVLQRASSQREWQTSNVSVLVVKALQFAGDYRAIAGFRDLSLLIKSEQQDVRIQLSQLFNSLYLPQL
eukprot:TRINITY_DN5471_c1_g1_i2.p1 TRINITY_DN5471_c1_g1~~TRINITY_DN5471_c1_g1_i2.p1  ORF type:complete len:596 (-),score=89.69 TRINITY_DN5471_c1_g1_i2:458-2053(-)